MTRVVAENRPPERVVIQPEAEERELDPVVVATRAALEEW
jgi:hypothetical protein